MKHHALARLAGLLLVCAVLLPMPVRAYTDAIPQDFFIPPLEERLTYSGDGSTATLFAPHVTRSSGWYDVNKNFRNDTALCWAASCSNVIAWYQDVCAATGVLDVSGYERDVERIFDRFRENWEPLEGQDPVNGMNWYFTGGFASGQTQPHGLRHPHSGGYLRGLPHCDSTWFLVNPAASPTLYGSYGENFAMLDDLTGVYFPSDPFYSLASFSAAIRRQLTYGACVIMVGSAQTSAASSHAITLWGCDYDVETELVTAIYVTDSDDEDRLPGHQLKRLGIAAKQPDREGVRIQGYYLSGNSSPLDRFLGSMVFFAPDATKEAPPPPQPAVQLSWTDGLRVQNTGSDARTVCLLLAAYEDGRQRSLTQHTAYLVPGQSRTFAAPAEAGLELRAFAADERFTPLCPPLTRPASS